MHKTVGIDGEDCVATVWKGILRRNVSTLERTVWVVWFQRDEQSWFFDRYWRNPQIRLNLTSVNVPLPSNGAWLLEYDLGCRLATGAIRKNRFLKIKKYCHIADNRALSESRVAKVAPLYEQLNKSLMQFGIFDYKLWYHAMGTAEPGCSLEGSLCGSGTRSGCCARRMNIHIRPAYTVVEAPLGTSLRE